jgi:methyl-accepting chemotaxis protein
MIVEMKSKPGMFGRINGKITLLFSAIIGVLLVDALGGVWVSWQIAQTFSHHINPLQSQAVGIVSMESDFKKQVQEWKDVLLRGKDPELFKKHWSNFEQQEATVQKEGEALFGTVTDPQAKDLIAQFVAAHRSMGQSYRAGLEQFQKAGFDSGAGDKAVAGMDRTPTTLLSNAKDRLVTLAASEAKAADDKSVTSIAAALIAMLAIVVVAVPAVMFMVRKLISRPLSQAVESLTELAGGHTDIEIGGTGRSDELGDIARAMITFKQNIETEHTLLAEKEAERTARDARTRQREQATAAFQQQVSQLIAALNQSAGQLADVAGTLTSTATDNVNKATATSLAAGQTSVNVQTVASATEQLSASIQEINRQVTESAERATLAVADAQRADKVVSGLAEAADRIGTVVALIQEIAGQTNLLALNATIEAARAGDAGKGFAVVASEVKTLANQTARATQEIGTQVGAIQGATSEMVAAIQQIVRTIREISNASSAIAAAINQQGAATAEIARNVSSAADSTNEVTANVAFVTTSAESTQDSVRTVASAADRLSSNSQSLTVEIEGYIRAMAG